MAYLREPGMMHGYFGIGGCIPGGERGATARHRGVQGHAGGDAVALTARKRSSHCLMREAVREYLGRGWGPLPPHTHPTLVPEANGVVAAYAP